MIFDYAFAQRFSNELKEALNVVAEKNDVRLLLKNFKYSDSRIIITLEGCIEDAFVAISPDEKVQWDMNCRFIGMKPDHYGKTFRYDLNRTGMTTMKVVGCRPRGKSYKVICLDTRTNKRYKFTTAIVLANLPRLEGV